MSRKKKLGSIIGALLIVSVITACGQKESAPEQTDGAIVTEDSSTAENGAAVGDSSATEDSSAAENGTGTEDGSATEDGAIADDAGANADNSGLSGRANADTGEGKVTILQEGDIAPDFTAELSGGGSFKLSDYDDKTVIINFWASWCGPCVGEMPAFEMLKNDKIEDLEIVCINCMEDKETVDQFVAENGYTFNIGYDVDGRIITYYPTEGIPYTLVVKKGVISNIFVGAVDADYQYKEYKNAISE